MKTRWEKKSYDDGTGDFYYIIETPLFDILSEDETSIADLYWNTEGLEFKNNRDDLKKFVEEFYKLISRYTIEK